MSGHISSLKLLQHQWTEHVVSNATVYRCPKISLNFGLYRILYILCRNYPKLWVQCLSVPLDHSSHPKIFLRQVSTLCAVLIIIGCNRNAIYRQTCGWWVILSCRKGSDWTV